MIWAGLGLIGERERLLQSYFRTHLWLEASLLSLTLQLSIVDINDSLECTANVCRELQGLCWGFLQYLQGKPCNIYRFSL